MRRWAVDRFDQVVHHAFATAGSAPASSKLLAGLANPQLVLVANGPWDWYSSAICVVLIEVRYPCPGRSITTRLRPRLDLVGLPRIPRPRRAVGRVPPIAGATHDVTAAT